jgi:hypothetical protein
MYCANTASMLAAIPAAYSGVMRLDICHGRRCWLQLTHDAVVIHPPSQPERRQPFHQNKKLG